MDDDPKQNIKNWTSFIDFNYTPAILSYIHMWHEESDKTTSATILAN